MGPRKRLRLTEVNPLLVCVLCGGYLIDATAIVECLHSFCRSCIIKYLEGNSFCPICDVQIHKAKPFRNIKPDKALQCIVYKLVPGLYHAEMARRREFYSKYPDYAGSTNPEDRGMGLERMIYAPGDKISLSLEYYDSSRDSDESDSLSASSNTSCSTELVGAKKRYLLCPALVTIGNLKKFLRYKYDLKPAQKVDVFHKRENLSDDLTLMDVAYIYTWKRNGPMEFLYRFNDVCRRPSGEDVTTKPREDVMALEISPSICVVQADQEQNSPAGHEHGSTELPGAAEPFTPPQLSHIDVGVERVAKEHSEASYALVPDTSDGLKNECTAETTVGGFQVESERTNDTVISGEDKIPPDVTERTEISKVSQGDGLENVNLSTVSNEKQVAQEPDSSVKSTEDSSGATLTVVDESKPVADSTVCLTDAKRPLVEDNTCSSSQHTQNTCKSPAGKDSPRTFVMNIEKSSCKSSDDKNSSSNSVMDIDKHASKSSADKDPLSNSVMDIDNSACKSSAGKDSPSNFVMDIYRSACKSSAGKVSPSNSVMDVEKSSCKSSSGKVSPSNSVMDIEKSFCKSYASKESPRNSVIGVEKSSCKSSTIKDSQSSSVTDIKKSPCNSSTVKETPSTSVIDTEKPSRISIGLLASLALERRSNSSLSITLSRKRVADDSRSKMDAEKRARLAIKPIPNHSNVTSSLGVPKSSLSYTQGQEKSQPKTSLTSSVGSSGMKDMVSCIPGPGKLIITPVPLQKPQPDSKAMNEEPKSHLEVQGKPSQFASIIENCERPKRPMSHMPVLQTPPSPSKSIYDPLNSKISTIPRLIEINSVGAAKTNLKKSRISSKRVTKRGDSQKHDGFGALDLSGSTRKGQHSADILTIAQNLARRQQMLVQASAPTPPLSPLSSLSAFPVPNFVPVRSPPPPLRIPVPPTTSSSYRHQHPHQQRPSSLSSSSPSPPAENGSTPSRSPRVGASPHDIFPNPGLQNHYLHPPSPSNSTLMFRSRFELQNPWHGEWYNDHLMRRCLESLRRGEGLPSTPYFAYPTSASANSNKNTVPK